MNTSWHWEVLAASGRFSVPAGCQNHFKNLTKNHHFLAPNALGRLWEDSGNKLTSPTIAKTNQKMNTSWLCGDSATQLGFKTIAKTYQKIIMSWLLALLTASGRILEASWHSKPLQKTIRNWTPLGAESSCLPLKGFWKPVGVQNHNRNQSKNEHFLPLRPLSCLWWDSGSQLAFKTIAKLVNKMNARIT